MVVGDAKPIPELLEMIDSHQRVLVVGCRGCVTVCNVGGEKEVGIIATALRIARKKEGRPPSVGEATVNLQCEPDDLDELDGLAGQYDAMVSLACGVGPQFLAERYPGMAIYPGINTRFIGGAVEHGVWSEKCQACGACLLHDFGGLCPIARCSKSLMNGPCGGSAGGKCEVDPDVDCVWHQIVERMEAQGRLHELEPGYGHKNWMTARDGGPRRRVLKER